MKAFIFGGLIAIAGFAGLVVFDFYVTGFAARYAMSYMHSEIDKQR